MSPPPWKKCLLVLPVVLLCACGGEDSGPATVRIFGLDPASGTYGEFDARLDTLHDVTQMRGDAVTFRGGATIKADALAQSSDPKSADVLQARGGGPVDCQFTEVGGVLHAQDYDSLNMASSYWALEQARALFVDLGVDAGGLNPISAYYHPRLELGTKLVPTFFALTDNAAYAPTFDGFMIVPHVLMDSVPFSMNLGVMAHEYAHKVYNRLVERDARVPAWLRNDWESRAANQLRGVDEGVADMFAHLLTGDPNFIARSTGDLDVDRDMRKARRDDDDMVDAWLAVPDAEGNVPAFLPHELGAHVAGALYELGEALGGDEAAHRRVAVALLGAQRRVAEGVATVPQYDFSTLGFFDFVNEQLAPSEQAAFCRIVEARFPTLWARDTDHAMETCP